MAFNWNEYETEQEAPSNFDWNSYESEQPQSEFNWDAYKTETKSNYTKPKVSVKNMDAETFKKNVDKIYDVPQVEIPQRGVLTNSDGIQKGGYVGATNKPLTPEQQAKIAQIQAEYEARNKQIDAEHRKAIGRITLGGLMQGASALPIFNIPYVGTGVGGALFEAGQGVMEGDKANDILKKAGTGFAVGETVGAIPYVGKYVGKTKAGQAVGNAVANSAVGKAVGNAVQKIATSQAAQKAGEVLSKEIPLPKVGKGTKPSVKSVKVDAPEVELKTEAKILTPEEVQLAEKEIAEQAIAPEVTNNVARKVEPQGLNVGKEMKPSKLKGTMQKAGNLPKELENKPIEYEVLHNPDTVARAQNAIGADAEGVHRDLLKKISGQGDYEHYVLSADDVVKARELATQLYKEGKNTEAVELTEGIIKAASKTGQALQAYTLWARTTPEGAVTYAEKILDRYNKSQHKDLKLSDAQREEIMKLAENVQKTTEGTRDNEVAIGLMQKYIANLTPASWQKKYDTFRYMNMLLSPKSRNKDIILTGIDTANNAIDEAIANGIDRVRTLIPGQQRAFSGLHPTEWFNGLKKGFNEGMEDVSLGINTSRSGEVGRYGVPKTPSFNYKPLSEVEGAGNKAKQAFENIFAGGEKGLNYTIQVPDRTFYEARYAASLADQMAVAGTNKPTQAMLDQARKEALEAVYQDNSWISGLGNSTRNIVNDLSTRLEGNFNLPEGSVPRVGNFIAPFVTTPANIVNIGLKNTFGGPVGLAKLLASKTPQEIRDAEMLIAKNIKGLGAATGFGLALDNGLVKTNIGQDSYADNAVTGLKPQSIMIGDKAFSIKDYPQIGVPLNVYLGYKEGGIPKAISNTAEAIGNISALSAVGDIQNAFKPTYIDEEMTTPKVINRLMRRQGANILSQNIPFGGFLGEVRNDIDPYAREMFMPEGETTPEMLNNTLQYTGNRILNRIPVASTLLPLKYNAVGKPTMINNIENPIARVASEALDFGVRNYEENPVYNELEQFKEDIKDTDYDGKTRVGLHTPSRSVKVNGETLKMDNEQYSDFSRDYTQINYILKGMAINSPEYEAMDDKEKTAYLSDLRKSVEEAVKMVQFGHEPSRKLNKYTQYILDNYAELLND